MIVGIATKKVCLKRNVIPSQNLPADKNVNIKRKEEERLLRRMEREKTKIFNTNKKEKVEENDVLFENSTLIEEGLDNQPTLSAVHLVSNNGVPNQSEMEKEVDMHEVLNDALSSFDPLVLHETASSCDFPQQRPMVKDQAVQVKSDFLVPKFLHFLKNDKELSTMTGIESFKILHTIVKLVKSVKIENRHQNQVKMDIQDKILMTFVKLKQNLSYRALAIIFNCYTAVHCKRVFYDTVKILSDCLEIAVPWPTREEICKNLPQCFEGFENVRIVLECTEIFIQRPKNLCRQIITYSSYKKTQTAKLMTGVSPAGNITFISLVYGGRASDTAIFSQSILFKLLEPGDGIMVDKGFLIDEACAKNGWKLIRPPFLQAKKQFNKAESMLTSRIAKARVHVERSNQRIKTFKIVGTRMPGELLPILEDIFKVICATINMSSPIMSDSKFFNNA